MAISGQIASAAEGNSGPSLSSPPQAPCRSRPRSESRDPDTRVLSGSRRSGAARLRDRNRTGSASDRGRSPPPPPGAL
eukprot:scaffold53541_cov36-Prasinocladus_malaysianus.AAC.1